MLSVQLTNFVEAGTDEAGRGCLAGPVTAAAVILPPDVELPLLNDSKKLTEKQRDNLRPLIEQQALAFGVAHVFQDEIDQINILKASINAMHLALEQLQKTPEYILVDGNKFSSFSSSSSLTKYTILAFLLGFIILINFLGNQVIPLPKR